MGSFPEKYHEPMNHFQIWQLQAALSRGVDGFSLTCPCQKLKNVDGYRIDHEQSLFFLGPSSKTPETRK